MARPVCATRRPILLYDSIGRGFCADGCRGRAGRNCFYRPARPLCRCADVLPAGDGRSGLRPCRFRSSRTFCEFSCIMGPSGVDSEGVGSCRLMRMCVGLWASPDGQSGMSGCRQDSPSVGGDRRPRRPGSRPGGPGIDTNGASGFDVSSCRTVIWRGGRVA
jgi:hypothetical protein